MPWEFKGVIIISWWLKDFLKKIKSEVDLEDR
jgi:hypothetical protein